MEDVITAQWGTQIKSAKDIFQFDNEEERIYTNHIPGNKVIALVN